MKKFLMISLAVLISVAFVTTVFAQGPTDKAPTSEKKIEKKVVAPKAKTPQYTGEVTAMDGAAKTLTVKGKTDEKTFDVANVKMKKEPKAGDKVMVKYTEKDGKMIASSVVGVKGTKKAPAKAEKKEAPKKEEVKPAPAPTPAPAK